MTIEEAIAKWKLNFQEYKEEPTRDYEEKMQQFTNIRKAEDILQDLKALKQPEIVRCVECKHVYNRSAIGQTRLFCDFDSARKYVIGDTIGVEFEVCADDYCSYGERRSK